MPNKLSKPLPEGIAAAKDEIDVLDVLAHGVASKIASLSRRPQSLGRIDTNELALIDNQHLQLKAFQELAHRVYGRTAIGTEVDEKDRPKGTFTYRITQANVGYVEKGCIILPRNSRLASELVTAQPGDDRDIETPTGERYLNVREVRTLDGPVSLRSSSEEPNFRSMAIRRLGLKRPIVVDDLRTTVQDFLVSLDEIAPETTLEDEPRTFDDADPAWLLNWNGIYLGESDDQSLGHQFITRTTVDQERALSNPRGLTFVEGVAGAGKTSVALGRLKFFANFETGAERDQYGLQNASDKDFAPAGMAGFVLSHSLKRYLKETADALELIHLPIKDFEEFRGDLSNAFGISDRFKRRKGANSPIRSRMDWLRALDVAMAHERPSLPECDLVALVIFAGMISDGFDHVDQSHTLKHLYQIRKHTAVFIDEVQDFTEIEVVLMGMSATSAYSQITLSGDRHQQLQSSGADNFEDLFPWVTRSARNRTIFLDQNFRQRSELASLSAGFRSTILGDDRVGDWKGPSYRPATIYRYDERERLAEFIVSRVRQLPHRATVAIIVPTVNEAQRWFDLLDDDLGAYHRPAMMSRRDDLTKRVNVHFAEVRETKGLEFDAVVVPDLGAYDLDAAIGRNQVYVAISRAKHCLMLGCSNSSIARPDIRRLEQEGLLIARDI